MTECIDNSYHRLSDINSNEIQNQPLQGEDQRDFTQCLFEGESIFFKINQQNFTFIGIKKIISENNRKYHIYPLYKNSSLKVLSHYSRVQGLRMLLKRSHKTAGAFQLFSIKFQPLSGEVVFVVNAFQFHSIQQQALKNIIEENIQKLLQDAKEVRSFILQDYQFQNKNQNILKKNKIIIKGNTVQNEQSGHKKCKYKLYNQQLVNQRKSIRSKFHSAMMSPLPEEKIIAKHEYFSIMNSIQRIDEQINTSTLSINRKYFLSELEDSFQLDKFQIQGTSKKTIRIQFGSKEEVCEVYQNQAQEKLILVLKKIQQELNGSHYSYLYQFYYFQNSRHLLNKKANQLPLAEYFQRNKRVLSFHTCLRLLTQIFKCVQKILSIGMFFTSLQLNDFQVSKKLTLKLKNYKNLKLNNEKDQTDNTVLNTKMVLHLGLGLLWSKKNSGRPDIYLKKYLIELQNMNQLSYLYGPKQFLKCYINSIENASREPSGLKNYAAMAYMQCLQHQIP